jgi:hypothetical protein
MAHAPMTRGVSQLMYVGDDDAVELASGKPSGTELAGGAVAAYVALSSKGLVRLVAGGIAAWVGYRAYKART